MITLFAKMWNMVFGETMWVITSGRKVIIHEYLKYFCFVVILGHLIVWIAGVIRNVV